MANIYAMADTWDASGTTFTAIKMDVDDQASASGSLLMDLQVGGTSRFNVEKDGDIRVLQTGVFNFGTRVNIRSGSDNNVVFGRTSTQFWVGLNEVVVAPLSGGYFGLGQYGTTVGVLPSTINVKLYPEAANTLAQRNDYNAQTFNLYKTYTNIDNYERGFMRWNVDVLEIGTQAAGTGSARPVRFVGSSSNDVSVLGSSSASLTLRTGTFPGTIRTSMFAGFGLGVVATETAHPLVLRSQGVERVRLDTVGSVQVVTALTVATLPASPLVGMIARVTDGDAGLSNGNTVVNSGAGATPYLVYYTGTNWVVTGTDTASVKSDTTQAGTGAAATSNIVTISQAAYDALTPDADTIYFITG